MVLSLGLVFSVAAEESPELTLGETRFQGITAAGGEVNAFLGVPFAQPPLGALRWKAPRPPAYRAGKYPAVEFSPACFQGDHITMWYRDIVEGFGEDPDEIVAPVVSEDCLYLNLWRPARQSGEALPVIVYVHGGSNRGGWSFEPNYHGHNLARRGVVVISIAYRLGPFGFFAHPDLEQSNFALQDIVSALRWIQEWAPAFGGDASRVTLMGESAGASNIAALLAVPGARGLFQRVIHQSAGWAARELPTLSTAQSLGVALQDQVGASSLAELRAVSAADIDAAAKFVYAEAGFDPAAGDRFLPIALSEQLEAGKLPPVDLLIGSNADEWKIYLTPGESLDSWLQQTLPKELHPQAVKAVAALGNEQRVLDALITAKAFVCPSLDLARGVTTAGAKSWVYYFSRVRPGKKASDMGAYHGAELPYVFDTHDSWLPTAQDDRILTVQMMDYWASFARNGNPNTSGLPAWPAFAEGHEQVMQLDSTLAVRPHPSAEICALLEDVKQK